MDEQGMPEDGLRSHRSTAQSCVGQPSPMGQASPCWAQGRHGEG